MTALGQAFDGPLCRLAPEASQAALLVERGGTEVASASNVPVGRVVLVGQ